MKKKECAKNLTFDTPSSRDSVGIRTQDPQLRRLLLYPAELRNQYCQINISECKSTAFLPFNQTFPQLFMERQGEENATKESAR